MLETIKEILTHYVDLPADEIRDDAKLVEELNLTSFAVMGLMGELEEEFGITVDETELTDIRTVEDIATYVQKKQQE